MSRSTRTISKIKTVLAIYENDCLLAAPDEECKSCTRIMFDSIRNIIEEAEKEAAADEEWHRNRPRLYKCDPEKNTECTKEGCQWLCKMTTCKKYSTDGRELSDDEVDEIGEENPGEGGNEE